MLSKHNKKGLACVLCTGHFRYKSLDRCEGPRVGYKGADRSSGPETSIQTFKSHKCHTILGCNICCHWFQKALSASFEVASILTCLWKKLWKCMWTASEWATSVVQQPCVVLWRHFIFHFNFVTFYWVFDIKH